MRRFYAPADNFGDDLIALDGDQTMHLRNVLRLRVGEDVCVFDGEGREFRSKIDSIGKNTALLRLIEEVQPASPESPLELTVAVGLLKGEKFDLVIQKSVELGVTFLVPLMTLRCDVKPKDAERRVERWRKIALESTRQCGRARLMKIASPKDFSAFLEETNDIDCRRFLFSERGGCGFPEGVDRKRITALIGPEGGWDNAEIQTARERGVEIITLAGRILRAETAAISIAAILQHRFGDLG